MKTIAFLPAALLAYTAAAELQLYAYPTPEYEKRDIDAVNTAISNIQDAITQLDDSVKAFASSYEGSQVKDNAENLVSTIKDGAEAVASSGAISLDDALGLQDVATQLGTSGQALLKDLQSKKAEFEASDLCNDVQSTIGSVSSEVQTFVDNIIKQLPEESQAAAKLLTNGISSSLSSGSSLFQCSSKGGDASSSAAALVTSTADAVADDYPVASSSSAAATASETCLAITVTVTAPCACESTSIATPTSSSVPVITPSTTVLYPTGSNSTSIIPTGGVSTTPATSIPTAGAVSNGVGAAGLMAGLMAALLV